MVLALFAYLGLFAWNARTGYLDSLAERSGLEVVSYILAPVTWAQNTTSEYWNRYVNLVDVAEENDALRKELDVIRLELVKAREDKAELQRLQQIFELGETQEYPTMAARVIAARFGMMSVLKTITINKGFLQGAVAGTPVIAPNGAMVGKITKASPNAASVLLITDPGFSVAVISQESRTPGVLSGKSADPKTLSLKYIARTASILEGETIVTSGLDGIFPKGIPVGIVAKISENGMDLFQEVEVTPLIDQGYLEDVLIIMPEGVGVPVSQSAQDRGSLQESRWHYSNLQEASQTENAVQSR